MATIEGRPKNAWDISTDDGRWDVTFLLGPWREVGGRWQKSPVYVRFLVPTQRAAKAILAKFRFSNIVIRMSASKTKNPSAFNGKLPITEVEAEVEAPKRPKPIQDPFFGRLKYDDGREAYVAWCKIAASSCEVSIVPAMVAKARPIVERFVRNLNALLDAITRKLLPLYNKTWREGGPELSASAFRAKVAKLSEVEIGKTQTTLRFHGGKLFTDHAIEVRLASTGRVSGISLA